MLEVERIRQLLKNVDLDEWRAETEGSEDPEAHAFGELVTVGIRTLPAIISQLDEMHEMLEEVRDHGLVYWEPNTQRGHIRKTEMLGRINTLLSRISGEAHRQAR